MDPQHMSSNTDVTCHLQTAVADAEKRHSELLALQREHQQAKSLHAAALKEVEALHAGHASAAQRAEEAIAELALVRETQAALTAQVPSLDWLSCSDVYLSHGSTHAVESFGFRNVHRQRM